MLLITKSYRIVFPFHLIVSGLIPKKTRTTGGWVGFIRITFHGANISHLGRRKIKFNHALAADMLVPTRIYLFISPFKMTVAHEKNQILPSRKLTCHLKRDHFKRKIAFQPHHFSGDVLLFRGVKKGNHSSAFVFLLCEIS